MRFLATLLLALCAVPAFGQRVRTYVPAGAVALLPVVVATQYRIWPDAPMPSFLAGQIEQESCVSLKHSKCWNPNAQLKTKREWGYGLGQTTIAYRADGSVRFNKQAELRDQYASLRDWSDDKKFDANYQITALVEMDKGIFRRTRGAASELDQLAFTLSAYNGGESGVRQDRLLCRNIDECDPNKWFGNVEKYSLKSRKPNPGYGESAFAINRGYITNVIFVRRPKYDNFFRAPDAN